MGSYPFGLDTPVTRELLLLVLLLLVLLLLLLGGRPILAHTLYIYLYMRDPYGGEVR